jgi:hypothetical protein
VRRGELHDTARGRLLEHHDAPHVLEPRHLLGGLVQLHVADVRVQHAASRLVPQLDDAAHVLGDGHLLGGRLQLHADRHGVLVRLQRRRVQRRPVLGGELHDASGG